MKNISIIAFFFAAVFSSCKKDAVNVTLNEQEKSDLTFIRQEEKLARDVYVYAYNLYNDDIFLTISNSEQSHINSVLSLMKKYSLDDPLNADVYGVFQNTELQLLYDELTAKVDSSLTHALIVGATIEDLDINDIKSFIANTTNTDLLNKYDKLTCGSRNHLRSFVSRLGNYTPRFISQTEYDVIINSGNEQCGN